MKQDKLMGKFKELVTSGKDRDTIIKELGISQRTYYYWKKKLNYSITPPPKIKRIVEETIQHKKEQFKFEIEKENYFDNLNIKIKDDKPIGILFMGDPHLDNQGTNLDKLEEDLKVAKEVEGVYAVGLGDYLDNWVGYLTKLYGEQTINQNEAFDLVKYYFSDINWFGLIVGNHDLFQSVFPYYLREIVGENVPMSEFIRIHLNFGSDVDKVTIHMRHNFNGKSQYNPAFPLVKQAIFNYPDDIIIQGHTHQTGYSIWVQPFGYLSHCIVVGSYKEVDKFGKKVGLLNQNHSPSCLVIINHKLNRQNPDRIKVFFDIQQGVDYLNFIRSKGVI